MWPPAYVFRKLLRMISLRTIIFVRVREEKQKYCVITFELHSNVVFHSKVQILTLKFFEYRITSNKRRGRSFNFLHFWWGVYSREAFTRGRHLHEGGIYYKIQRELQFYISTSMISSSSSIRKTALYYL